MDIYTLHFDGSCGPKNPGGTAAYGFSLRCGDKRLAAEHGVIGSGPAMSNNVAEFTALFKGLEAFHTQSHTPAFLQVRGDSQIVINIMSKKWKAHSDKMYYQAYLETEAITRAIRRTNVHITFDWIPREQNTECDDLSKAHLERANLA